MRTLFHNNPFINAPLQYMTLKTNNKEINQEMS